MAIKSKKKPFKLSFKKILLLLIAVIILLGILGNNVEEKATAVVNKKILEWEYETTSDNMGRGDIKIARIFSQNEIDLKFPYNGIQRALLQIRKNPKQGNDVLLALNKAQFLCSSYRGCRVNVKFDNEPPESYPASEPSDRSTNLLFIGNEKKFISKAKKAEVIKIEAEFYQNGTKVFEFNSKNLNWEDK